jgi:hypothetical protein
MSEKKARKLRFLAQHPRCCFCAGDKPAAEPDHVPGRVFFRERHWPVGYEFPACVECNRATRLDEQAVALLARIYPDAETEEAQREIVKLMGEVRNNHPGLFEEMNPSIRQYRYARARYGLVPPAGQPVTALPVLSVSGRLVNDAIANVSRKLFCALFYKHVEQILTHAGGIGYRWYSNLTAQEIPKEIAPIVPGMPVLERNAKPLNDQFFYRWGVTDTKRMAAFLVTFNLSFAILGVVTQDANSIPIPQGSRILMPYTRGA